jgi:hypothetical protein
MEYRDDKQWVHQRASFHKPLLDPCIPCLPWLLIFLLFYLQPLPAQTEEKSWSIRVAALDIAEDHHTLWLRTGTGKEPVEVPLNTRIFSLPIDFKSPAALAFYRSSIEASAEKPPAPLATTVLKSASSLIVFSPAADQKKYEAFTIADADFPFGSFRLVNFSSATVRAEFSGKPTLLKPGAAETITIRDAQNATPVRILALAEGTAPRLIRQSSWSIIPTQRELVLLFPNPDNGLVRLRHFVDTKAEEPEE